MDAWFQSADKLYPTEWWPIGSQLPKLFSQWGCVVSISWCLQAECGEGDHEGGDWPGGGSPEASRSPASGRKGRQLGNIPAIEEESDRRVGRGRHYCLGDILDCHNSHLAARMIWRKVFGRTSILGGWCMVWWGVNLMVIHFYETAIPPSGLSSIHPFLQIILMLTL